MHTHTHTRTHTHTYKHTYTYTNTHIRIHIRWFFEVLSELGKEDLALMIQFITGTPTDRL